MTGRHLGADAAAFVDGALDLVTRDRVVAHLASCAACRDAVADQRRVKSALAGLAAPPLPPGLADRLRGLAVPAAPALPAPRADGSGTQGWVPVSAPAASAPVIPLPVHRRRRRAGALAGVGGAAVLTALAVASAAGGQAVAEPVVTPPVDRFAAAHVVVAGAPAVGAPGLHLTQAALTGGVAPGMAAAPGTMSWSLPGSAAPGTR